MHSGTTAPACTDNFYVACLVLEEKNCDRASSSFKSSHHFAAVLLEAPDLIIASQACKSLDFESEHSEAMRRIQKQPGFGTSLLPFMTHFLNDSSKIHLRLTNITQ